MYKTSKEKKGGGAEREEKVKYSYPFPEINIIVLHCPNLHLAI